VAATPEQRLENAAGLKYWSAEHDLKEAASRLDPIRAAAGFRKAAHAQQC
jgi:hypothetical protein